MPHFTLTCTPDGLELPVVLGLNGADTANLLAAGIPVPRPVQVRGVLDTGSDVSCTATRVVSQIGLRLFGRTTTQTAAGSAQVNLYEASLSLPMPGLATVSFLIVLDPIVVMELPNLATGIEAVVGLDVLYRLWLFFDGPRREFTLGD